jgi:hypothetical protein
MIKVNYKNNDEFSINIEEAYLIEDDPQTNNSLIFIPSHKNYGALVIARKIEIFMLLLTLIVSFVFLKAVLIYNILWNKLKIQKQKFQNQLKKVKNLLIF